MPLLYASVARNPAPWTGTEFENNGRAVHKCTADLNVIKRPEKWHALDERLSVHMHIVGKPFPEGLALHADSECRCCSKTPGRVELALQARAEKSCIEEVELYCED